MSIGQFRNCWCFCCTCYRDINSLGIASHRAMHRRKKEDCRIQFSDGRIESYDYSKTKPANDAD